LKTNSFLL